MSSNTNDKKKKDEELRIDLSMPLEEFLSVAFLVPMGDVPYDPKCIWGLPVMLHGSPGTAKTSRVRQAAAACGLECRAVELGGRQPEDASGAPFLTKNDELVIACTLGALNELNAIGQGVLFLDELTCARPATQGAFLTAVQERRVGDTPFSNHIRVVGAGNPPNEAAGGYQLQLPMANRFAHRDIKPPSVEEYINYITRGPVRNVADIQRSQTEIIEKWSEYQPTVSGLVAGFLNRFPNSLHVIPPPGHPDRGKAYPTARTIDYVRWAVTTCRILGRSKSDQAEFVAACAGMSTAVNWETWIAEADLPDPLTALTNGWKPEAGRLDKTHAVTTSAILYVVQRMDKKERLSLAPLAWNLLQRLSDANLADIAVPRSKELIAAGLGMSASKEIASAASPVYMAFHKYKLDELEKRVL